jgi:hypothetical protein
MFLHTMFQDTTLFHHYPCGMGYIECFDMPGKSDYLTTDASLNQDISLHGIQTSNVISMCERFVDATLFNQDISRWDTSIAASAYQTIQNTTLFNQNLSWWDTSNVQWMQRCLMMQPPGSKVFHSGGLGGFRLDLKLTEGGGERLQC